MSAELPAPDCAADEASALQAFRQRKDDAAFDALVGLHRDCVFDFARRLLGKNDLAEDAAQEAFVALYHKADQLPSNISLRGWLIEAARRSALKARRTECRRTLREGRYAMEKDMSSKPQSEPNIEPAELQRALNTLPQEMQLPIAMHYLHGLRRDEVAEVLQLPVGTVASRIARGLEKLRPRVQSAGLPSAALGVLALETSLKTLPLAKAPASLGAAALIKAGAVPASAASNFGPSFLFGKKAVAFALATVTLAGSAVWIGARAFSQKATSGRSMNSLTPVRAVPPSPTAPKGPVAHWKLDDADGTTVVDSSGNGRNGSLSGGTKWVPGKVGLAVEFDGLNGTMRADGVALDQRRSGCNSFAFWMKWNGKDRQIPIGFKGNYDLLLYGGGLGLNTGAGDLFGISSAGFEGKWVHIVAVVPNAKPTTQNTKFYINGVPQAITKQLGEFGSFVASSPVYLSGWGYDASSKFDGALDDVRLYDREITAEEAKELAQLSQADSGTGR